MLIMKMDFWKFGRWFVDFCKFQGHLEFWRKFIQCDCPLSGMADRGQDGHSTGFVSGGSVFIWVVEGWDVRVRVLVTGDEKSLKNFEQRLTGPT